MSHPPSKADSVSFTLAPKLTGSAPLLRQNRRICETRKRPNPQPRMKLHQGCVWRCGIQEGEDLLQQTPDMTSQTPIIASQTLSGDRFTKRLPAPKHRYIPTPTFQFPISKRNTQTANREWNRDRRRGRRGQGHSWRRSATSLLWCAPPREP